jgi:hypothetical protein
MLIEDVQVMHAAALVSIACPKKQCLDPPFAADSTRASQPGLVGKSATIDLALLG